MFFCNVYKKGQVRTLANNDWGRLRHAVAEYLRKNPGSRWGMLRRDDEVLFNKVRVTLFNYPKEEPPT